MEFDVIAPLDARRVRGVRIKFQEREQAARADPLVYARFEQEVPLPLRAGR